MQTGTDPDGFNSVGDDDQPGVGPENPEMCLRVAAPVGDDEVDDNDIPTPMIGPKYEELIQHSPELAWLASCLDSVARIDLTRATSYTRIQEVLLNNLPAEHVVSRRRTPDSYVLECRLKWDPVVFLIQEGYAGDRAWALRHTITLTGVGSCCQASTVEDYVKEIWPVTGLAVLDVLCRYVDAEQDTKGAAYYDPLEIH